MRSLTLMAPRVDAASLSFLAVTFITGVAVALQVPTLSLFLAQEVQVRPFLIGLFYTINAVAGIAVSQWLGKRSDDKGDRKKLILRCCFAGVALSLLFVWCRNYWLLATLGVMLSALTATASPQLFALAREYSTLQNKRADFFNSLMRSQFSLAWVVGPPLAFSIAIGYGFEWMYLASTAAYLLCAYVVWRWLPSLPQKTPSALGEQTNCRKVPRLRVLFLASTLSWTCNSMYLINMPLYVTNQLGFDEKWAGFLMGTAAALEIPVMLIAGFYAGRVGKRLMLLVAIVAGVAFYGGLIVLESQIELLLLQFFNAIFIGIVAGIGMSYFQDVIPDRPGMATTLFTNSARTGSIVAGAIAGVVAEFAGFHAVFVVALLLAFAALAASFFAPDV
ncbi:MAG: sugar efflux transporter [Vibrionaceae bacterium]